MLSVLHLNISNHLPYLTKILKYFLTLNQDQVDQRFSDFQIYFQITLRNNLFFQFLVFFIAFMYGIFLISQNTIFHISKFIFTNYFGYALPILLDLI